MTLQARLQKATRGLSPLQHIALVLQAKHEGREPDPELGRFADPQQTRAFNRYVALLYVINRELGAFCQTHRGFVESLAYCAEQVRLLEAAAGILEQAHGLEPVKRPRDWRSAGSMEVNEFLRSLAAGLRRGLADTVRQRWREAGALELLWDELSQEFGGADPVDPELRTSLGESKDRLLDLAALSGCRRRLEGPDEATLSEVRARVDDAFRQMEPLL